MNCYISDLHIHTEFSCDSEADMEQYILKAINENVQAICFTDHVDLNPDDYGFNYYNPDRYFAKYNLMKDKYEKKIKLLSGIEFGEPHLYPEKLEELSKYPYDFIIGSIHWIGNMFPCQSVREKYSAKEFFTLYWEEMLRTVKHGGFDALGHIDFPKRYYGEVYYTEQMLNEIFKYLLDQDRIIEVNTSSLRKGHSETMPDCEVLEIYKANGGRYVTIGSDVHVVEDMAADYEVAKAHIEKLGLQEVIYEQRRRVIL